MKKIGIIGHLFFLLAAVFLVVGIYNTNVSAKGMPKVVTLKAKMGNVKFNHKAHLKRHIKCTSCHHKINGKSTKKACNTCHKKVKNGKAPKAMTVFHKTCKGCHKKKGGPTKCKACHKK